MEVAGCIFDLPTSCVMDPARFLCGIMLRKVKFAILCVFHRICFVLSKLEKCFERVFVSIRFGYCVCFGISSSPSTELLSFLLQILDCKKIVEQDGAAEACWAHMPEVGRSKLPPANNFSKVFSEYSK